MKEITIGGVIPGYTYDDKDIYFNGVPLKRRNTCGGNDFVKIESDRGVNGTSIAVALNILNNGMQRCSKCLEDKPLSDFTTRTNSAFNIDKRCRICKKTEKVHYRPVGFKSEYVEDIRKKNHEALQSLKTKLVNPYEVLRCAESY